MKQKDLHNIYYLGSVGASFDPQPQTACLNYGFHNTLALTTIKQDNTANTVYATFCLIPLN